MSKKCYHFFGGLLDAQANWLNKMSEKGYRLIRAGKMLYEFEECKPKKRCTVCGTFFVSKSNSVKYCPDCRKRITNRQAAERMRKRRALVTR